ncbi:MAG: hypothetical protein CM1200mP30_31050 [Pseudomonadota bacterium]|nr:MAG: hypothetical protein CM1200mP30_31050 [Pseudomonadota bacterium]
MTSSLSSEEIDELITGTQSTSSFFGFSQEKISSTKQNMIISKAIKAIDTLKQIPLLKEPVLSWQNSWAGLIISLLILW